MKRQKKANNIFSKPILAQSLYYQEVQKQYRVGGVKIQGTWLKDVSPSQYKSGVNSALQISDLKGQINQIKKNPNQTTTDIFRMADLQKRMENFQLMSTSPTKKMKNQDTKIYVENLTLQKLTNFWGIYERKCKINDKKLIVASQKEKKEIQIDLKNYTIQLQEKGKANSQSSSFIWPQKTNYRLFLSGKDLRPYCLYGQQKILKNIIKKIKVQSIQMDQIGFLQNIQKQYKQKTLVNFGNKLRIYQHYLKQREKQNIGIAFDLLQKSHLLDSGISDQQNGQRQKMNNTNSMLQQSFNNSQSGLKNTNSNNNKNPLNHSINFNSSTLSPIMSPAKSLTTQSQFRIKARRSTIHYEDLDDEDQIDQKIQNFRLQIKQVAHSDSDSQLVTPNYQSQQNQLMKQNTLKKIADNKNLPQQQIIHQYMNEDSLSQDSYDLLQKQKQKQNKLKYNKKDQNQSKFQFYQKQQTHYLYLTYFEDFCAYSDSNILLTLYQTVIPEIQYQDMKTPVCTLQKIALKRDNDVPNLYYPQKPTMISLSKQGSRIYILFNNKITQIKQQLQINLNQILYAVDRSQLLYIKIQNRIQCAGKLKIIVSPNKINPKQYQQQTTIEFLTKYLIKQEYKKQDKYKFIDYKKRNYQICQKWNNKMMKRIINKGDQQQFLKAIFYGFPPSIYQKIVNNVKNMRKITRAQTKMQSNSNYFSTQFYALLEQQAAKMRVYDLRVFIKIDKLFDLIAQGPKNLLFQKRIDQVSMFLTMKFGKTVVGKFMAVLIIQILRKLQNLLLQLNNSKQIQIFLNQYFEVEFQIDNIMNAVSSYFS